MKESIYTIPISDVFTEEKGCPICRLYATLEDRISTYIMGAAMMEPDIRFVTNEKGFCDKHLSKIEAIKGKLPLALTLKTHLDHILNEDLPNYTSKKFNGYVSEKCYICDEIDLALNKMIENIISLYLTDNEFKAKFLSQDFYCLKHFELFIKIAKSQFNKKQSGLFISDLSEFTKKYLEGLVGNLDLFTQMFDYRNAHKTADFPDEVKGALQAVTLFLKGNL